MSLGPFPDRVDASKLFARHGHIAATLPLNRLTRLLPALASNEGALVVELQFGADAEGIKLLTGKIVGELKLQCQRCCGEMDYPIAATLALRVFETGSEFEQYLQDHGRDESDDDVLVLDELNTGESGKQHQSQSDNQVLDLLALVEDEVLLNLPLAAKHTDVGCNESLLRLQEQSDELARQVQDKVVSPFAALAQLKAKPKV